MADAPYPLSPADAALSFKQRQVRDILLTKRPATPEEVAALEPRMAPAVVDPKAPPIDPSDLAAVNLNGKWFVKK